MRCLPGSALGGAVLVAGAYIMLAPVRGIPVETLGLRDGVSNPIYGAFFFWGFVFVWATVLVYGLTRPWVSCG